MNDRLAGLLLFLPVPAVLLMFTWQPLGAWVSLALGALLMATHRLYARPFALARAQRRCLWCGRALGSAAFSLSVVEPSGETSWAACREGHRSAALRTFWWAAAHRRLLIGGILGSLGGFLLLAILAAGDLVAAVTMGDAVAVFRFGVAMSVLPLGWRGSTHGQGPALAPRLPFAVHIQALVGTAWVVWLFRLVGLWWLVAAALHLRQRLA